MIGEIMRRSVLGERRDIPQTGATKIDQLFYWGNAGLVYVSHGALDLRVDSRKPPMQARRESLRRAVMGKTSSAQDGITSSKVTAAPCLPSTKLPCAQLR